MISGLNFASEKAFFQQNARVCVHYILAKMHIFHRILLTSINFPGERKLLLKPNAVPTINKALDEAKSVKPLETKKRLTGILSRRKVSVSLQEGAIIKE